MLDTTTPAHVVALRNGGPFARPRLRGALHRVAAAVSPLLVVALVARAPDLRSALAATVYGATLVAMFAVSGLYHRPGWSPRTLEWLSRLDHATIFLFVAGSYVPIGLLAVGGVGGTAQVIAIAAGALVGIAQTLLWPRAPRTLHITLYVVIGVPGLFGIAAQRAHVGDGPLVLQAAGAVLYVLGAVTYSRRRPDPVPSVFGYHEVFHALVIAASACFYAAVYQCVRHGALAG